MISLDLEEENEVVEKLLNACLGMYGYGIDLACEDDSGILTVSPGVLFWDEKQAVIDMDLRHPLGLSDEKGIKRTKDIMGENGFDLDRVTGKKGHYVDPDSDFVQTLMAIYNRRTGRNAKPFAFSGGTYARLIPQAVAFGTNPEFDATRAHQPNEYISTQEMLFDMQLIAESIVTLSDKFCR